MDLISLKFYWIRLVDRKNELVFWSMECFVTTLNQVDRWMGVETWKGRSKAFDQKEENLKKNGSTCRGFPGHVTFILQLIRTRAAHTHTHTHTPKTATWVFLVSANGFRSKRPTGASGSGGRSRAESGSGRPREKNENTCRLLARQTASGRSVSLFPAPAPSTRRAHVTAIVAPSDGAAPFRRFRRTDPLEMNEIFSEAASWSAANASKDFF